MAEPSETAVKYLFAHSRNLCFYNMPKEKGCEVELTQRYHKRCLGQIAHIAAESPGGPRYDGKQTEHERQAEPNLMLLCPNHHKLIDELEPDRFDVSTLLEMKARHISHGAEGWKPDEAFVQRVALDMVAFYIEHRPMQFAPSSAGPARATATAHDASVSTEDAPGIISTDPIGPQPPTYAPDHPLSQPQALEPAISTAEGTFTSPVNDVDATTVRNDIKVDITDKVGISDDLSVIQLDEGRLG